MTERAIIAVWLALFAVVCAFGLGCGVKAKGIEQTSGRDSEVNALKAQINDLNSQIQSVVKAGGDISALKLQLEAQIAALRTNITTSAPVTQTGDNATANQNNAAVVLQYTGAGIGGAAVLGLWLRFMRRNNSEERAKEIKLAEIDAANDKHTMNTMAGLRDCQFRPPCEKKE